MLETQNRQTDVNRALTYEIINQALSCGVEHFAFCAGSRNSPFVDTFSKEKRLTVYTSFEERSMGFFMLGKCKKFQRPVAISTTSGTAAAELLPAIIEAHYSGQPLLIITADRPRNYRGTASPQTIEQVGLFGPYVTFEQDIAVGEPLNLIEWDRKGPAHLNVCFDDPLIEPLSKPHTVNYTSVKQTTPFPRYQQEQQELDQFLKKSNYPLVVVGALPRQAREKTMEFLLGLNAPVILEPTSGLREEASLQPLSIRRRTMIWESANDNNYPIDAILRIGTVPTVRLWRDLTHKKHEEVKVFSISHLPFSGVRGGEVIHVELDVFFDHYIPCRSFVDHRWVENDQIYDHQLSALINDEPQSELSLFHQLSIQISSRSLIYLGNSLPIREWDLTATYQQRQYVVDANRGAGGIDGQISTFLGMCDPGVDNWAIIGDLTALYDLAAPWLLDQMKNTAPQIIVVNNFGGKIFERLYNNPAFVNHHTIHFEHFAKMWGLDYECWERVPDAIKADKPRIIELRPNNESSTRFWEKLAKL